eukprot:tig00020965_g16833.t1
MSAASAFLGWPAPPSRIGGSAGAYRVPLLRRVCGTPPAAPPLRHRPRRAADRRLPSVAFEASAEPSAAPADVGSQPQPPPPPRARTSRASELDLKEADERGVRPTRAVVDLDALRDNYEAIQAHVGGSTKVMAVVKANAYGHGLVPVAKYLEEHTDMPYFAVAIVDEGVELRKAGIKRPILVLGGIVREQAELALQHGLTLTAHSIDKLSLIDAAAASLGVRARVHLEVDTGMERVGVHWYKARPFIQHSLERATHCEVEGFYSHFAAADAADLSSAREQLGRFREALALYDELGAPPPPIRHLANSGGLLQLPDCHFDMVRAGIALYGVLPSSECSRPLPLRPCLSLLSKVVYFKVVEEGAAVSYGHTWRAPSRIRVVTVPIGYADGFPRGLSNRGQVLIRGGRYEVVGRVCMDQAMVNIGWGEAYNGDEVVVIGEQTGPAGSGRIGAEDVAGWLGSIPYEVLTGISSRVPRIYVGADEDPPEPEP